MVRPAALVEPEREVHALHGGAGGALGEVVDGADGDEPVRGRASTVTWTCTALEPVTDLVCGHWPWGSRCTNGSSA